MHQFGQGTPGIGHRLSHYLFYCLSAGHIGYLSGLEGYQYKAGINAYG